MKNCCAVVSALAIVALSSAAGCITQDSPFVQIGQYRDSSNDRIFVVTYRPQTPQDAMRTFGMRSTNTSGRMTAVYFLPEGSMSPDTALRAATSLEQAIAAVAGSSGNSFVYRRATNGKETFTDCNSDPGHEMCQKQ